MIDPQLLDEFRKIQNSNDRSSKFTIWCAVLTLSGVIFTAAIGGCTTVQAVKTQNQNATIQFTKDQQASAYTQFISDALKLENELYNYANLFRPSDSSLANSSSAHFAQLRDLHQAFTTTYYNCKLFQPVEMNQSIDDYRNPLEAAYLTIMAAGIDGTTGKLKLQTIELINEKYNIHRGFNKELEGYRNAMAIAANKQLWS